MSKRIDEILAVLEVVANNFESNDPITNIENLRKRATRCVAEQYDIGRHTVQDKYQRQLKLGSDGTAKFDRLIHEWLTQDSIELSEILLQRVVDDEDEQKVRQFFTNRLNNISKSTPIAIDIDEPTNIKRSKTEIYRILRDTALARRIKGLHQNKCQICGSTIDLGSGEEYSEAHHIKPLGSPHNGPDVATNIIVVCPNHHVALDYGAMPLNKNNLRIMQGHEIGIEFIDYHNDIVFKAS